MLKESEMHAQSPIMILGNWAELFGGGIYAYKSLIDFTFQKYINIEYMERSSISGNTAVQSGGGVYAVASTIKLNNFYVTISYNTALHNGGGLYLQDNSKIYLIKEEPDNLKLALPQELNVQLDIIHNKALLGGGIFISDNSTARSSQCLEAKLLLYEDDTSATSDCFIQTIKLYQHVIGIPENFRNTYIINNTAKLGSAIYGGLLDRCTINAQAELYLKVFNGLKYLRETVEVSNNYGTSITSDPVQVVICGEYRHNTFTAIKGQAIRVNISAIDQVGNSVDATIHSSVLTESGVGRLKEGQAEQRVGNQCTELEFNVFSQDSYAKVELYADGPCGNFGISRQTFSVIFLPCTCPIGFQHTQSQIDCECVCDKKLLHYHITNCSPETGTIQLENDIWVGMANSTNETKYIIQRCPFDYCKEKPVNISLNSSQERDRQCAFSRSGVLCGECQQGLSLVLATSRCKECSNIYLLLIIPFALAGIALVVFILFFNITIATGTIHGLIFYSNLLPVYYFTQPSALTVFISWVNLDLGIETCFYNGMSSQAKVLLQLVFPTYLFLLIFIIKILSRYRISLNRMRALYLFQCFDIARTIQGRVVFEGALYFLSHNWM